MTPDNTQLTFTENRIVSIDECGRITLPEKYGKPLAEHEISILPLFDGDDLCLVVFPCPLKDVDGFSDQTNPLWGGMSSKQVSSHWVDIIGRFTTPPIFRNYHNEKKFLLNGCQTYFVVRPLVKKRS